MHIRTPAAIAALLIFSLPAMAQETTADTVVATVDGTEITLGHMVIAKSRLPEQYRGLPDEVLFRGLLEQLVQQAAVAARADGLSKAGELMLENERRALLVSEVLSAVTEAAVTEEAIQTAYEAAFADAEPEQEFNASHILVETVEEAQTLIDQIEAGADFADLARAHSTGPSGANGGDLGWFGRGMMVPEFENAVMNLEAGTVSEPVETQFGWHVIRLNETRTMDAPPLDDVRRQLVEEIQDAAVRGVLAEATDAAEITRIDPETIDPSVLSDPDILAE